MAVKIQLIIYINTQNVHWSSKIYSIVVDNDVKVFRIDIFVFQEHTLKFWKIGFQRINLKPIQHFLNIAFQNIFDDVNIIVSIWYTVVISIIVDSNIIVDEKYIIYKYVK